tara:strand:+ start:479 stop:1294 length:816 start_codon:yes stop_codon:yes gene_type:complete
MKITRYPDGTSYVEVSLEDEIDQYTWTTFRINSYDDFWVLNQFVDAYNSFFHKKPNIYIPNLLDAQADRRFAQNQPSSLKLICNSLNRMNARFKIFHPHNPEVVEALMDDVSIVSNAGFINKVLNDLSPINNLVMMSADAGGYKSVMKLAETIRFQGDVISASKSRKYHNGGTHLTQHLPDYDLEGKDVLIVDDICVYGGTFNGLGKLLRLSNVNKIYLAVSHMTVQNFKDPLLFYMFDGVFTTNSKFTDYWVPDSKGEPVAAPNLKIFRV